MHHAEHSVEFLLSEEERDAFERDGFIMVRQALTPAEVGELCRAADALDADYRASPDVTPFHTLNLHDLIGRDDGVPRAHRSADDVPEGVGRARLAHPGLPHPVDRHAARATGATPGAYGWHQDNNRMNLDLETRRSPASR